MLLLFPSLALIFQVLLANISVGLVHFTASTHCGRVVIELEIGLVRFSRGRRYLDHLTQHFLWAVVGEDVFKVEILG